MIIITWILIVTNLLSGGINFFGIFVAEEKEKRISNFISFVINLTTMYVCLSIVRGVI